MKQFKNTVQFLFVLMLLCSIPFSLSAQGGGGPHHGGGNHHHNNDGPGGGGWDGDDADSTDVHTPPSVGEVFAHLLEEGLADCLTGVDSSSFATIEDLFAYVQANCALPIDTLDGPHHGHGHGHGNGSCHTDSLDLDMPTVGEVFAHLLEEGLADCLSSVDSSSFATVAELFAYVQANCDMPADTTDGPHGPHHGHHGHHGHKVAAAQQGTSGKTALGTAVGLTVSPNPVKGSMVTISANAPVAQYRVFDMSGKLMMNNTANGNQTFDVNLGNLPQGIYLIQIQTTNGGVSSQKVIVE